MSIREISSKTGLAKSTLSGWLKNVELTAEQKNLLSERNPATTEYHKSGKSRTWLYAITVQRKINSKAKRVSYQRDGANRVKNGVDSLFVTGCALYWAEGSKKKDSAILCNTDANMLRIFILFLETCFKIEKSRISFSVQYHKREDESKIRSYWLLTLGLPESSARKFYCSDNRVVTGKKTKIHPNGICSVMLHDTKIVQMIYGAIKELNGIKDEALWIF